MNDEVYLSGLEWSRMHDEIGGVIGNIVYKDGMSYEKYQKLLKSGYFILCDKDYITNLQQENEKLKLKLYNVIEFVETNPLIWKPNMEITKLIENPNFKDMLYYKPDEWLHKLHTILKGDDENEIKRNN